MTRIWIERQLERLAAWFEIDLLGFSILSNHFYLILRSRPDAVALWDDTEVARRWQMLTGQTGEPTHSDGQATKREKGSGLFILASHVVRFSYARNAFVRQVKSSTF